MSSQDLLKFLTKEFVQYVETPKEKRLEQKQERLQQRVNWSHHWFGLLPLAIGMVLKPIFNVSFYILRHALFWKRHHKETR